MIFTVGNYEFQMNRKGCSPEEALKANNVRLAEDRLATVKHEALQSYLLGGKQF